MLLFGLRMEGFLFLGSSENPNSIIQNLEVVNKKWKIYRNLESKRIIRLDAFAIPDVKNTTPSSREDSVSSTINSLTEAVNEALLREKNTLVICVDTNNKVVKTYGDTSKFLLQKNFTTNLVELLPKELVVALNNLSAEALKSNINAFVNGIAVVKDEITNYVNLSVIPLIVKKGEKRMLMVTFKEELNTESTVNHTAYDEKAYHNQYTENIEEEIKELKERLDTAYLELDASNENMQSFNEELLSANEEMQSTNEEMQSVNEELHTINTDYQLKNKELVEINDDLNNYFRSNINGQLFVNNDLLLMKFSPGTVKQINLLPTDIGRPLSNISTNFKFETIIDDIKKVIEEGVIFTKEIETNNGKWYQVNTMPYVQNVDNKRNGAIITFNDITELKSTQIELAKKNKSLVRINADLDNFVYTTSHDLLAPLTNIEGIINFLSSVSGSEPDILQASDMLNISIQKFKSLIRDIATIAKTESEMLEQELVNLNEVLDNVEWSLADKIKQSGTVVHRNLEVGHIRFSKKNMRSILFNLISNGIKFKGENSPVINVNTVKEEDFIILSVQDNGSGISKSGIEKIFDMYGRLQSEVEGQGIGIFLVKKIVNASNGDISVESEPGMGSKFKIILKSNELVLANEHKY